MLLVHMMLRWMLLMLCMCMRMILVLSVRMLTML